MTFHCLSCVCIFRYLPLEILRNLSLAFRLADEALGISPLLEVEDLVTMARPDTLSVMTYLAQFYHALALEQPDTRAASESDSGISSARSSLTSSSRSLSLDNGHCHLMMVTVT